MIVSFFARGSGGGNGPVDYLLGKDRDREKAQVLSGDPDETAALIDSSHYTKKYTSGVLSFEERQISDEKKRAVMASFEDCLFPGMDKDQYNVLWVEHTDKGRLELNFVIPNLELTTGKRLQPYYHAADFKRVDAWRTIQNLEHGFSDPEDPAKKQTLVLAKDLPRNKLEAATAINDALQGLALRGAVTCRDDVITALEQAGFEVARQTKSSISIKDPEGGRNIRLKGAIYEQDFRLSQELQSDIEQRSREHQQGATGRLEAARERFSYGIEQKQRELEKRYSRKQPSVKARDLRQSAAHEYEPIQDMALGDSLTRASWAGVDRLERMAGRHDIQPEYSDSTGQRSVRGVTRASDSGKGQGRNVLDTGLEHQDETRGLSIQSGQLGHQGGQVNDGNREAIARHVENINQRARTLRERAQDDKRKYAEQLGSIGDTGESLGGIKRAGRAVERAKQGIDRAVTAVNQFVQAVKEKVREKSRSMGFSR